MEVDFTFIGAAFGEEQVPPSGDGRILWVFNGKGGPLTPFSVEHVSIWLSTESLQIETGCGRILKTAID